CIVEVLITLAVAEVRHSLRRRYYRRDRYRYKFFFQVSVLRIENADLAFESAGDHVLAVRRKRHGEESPGVPLQFLQKFRVFGAVNPHHSAAAGARAGDELTAVGVEIEGEDAPAHGLVTLQPVEVVADDAGLRADHLVQFR